MEAVKQKVFKIRYALDEFMENKESSLQKQLNKILCRNLKRIKASSWKQLKKLEFAYEDLKNDGNFIMEAVKQDGGAL